MLACHLKLKFVGKDDDMYRDMQTIESVHFVAVGSVGLFRSPADYFPYDVMKNECKFLLTSV